MNVFSLALDSSKISLAMLTILMINMLEDIEKDILHIASGTFNFRKLQDLKCLFRNCSPEIIAKLFAKREVAETLFRMSIEISVDTIIQFGIDGEIDQLVMGGFSK